MRKALAIFLSLIIICAGCMCYAHVSIVNDRDKVTFEENILLGDALDIEGVTVNINATANGQLNWNTTYIAGQNPTVKTDYNFTAQPTPREYIIENSFNLDNYLDVTYNDYSDPAVKALEQAYLDLAADTAPGTENSRDFLLADYIDYYPINAYISLPDGGYHHSTGTTMILSSASGEMEEGYELQGLRDFLKIPVLPDHSENFTIYKSPDGNISTVGHGTSDTGDHYDLWGQGAFTDDAIYFSISTETTKGNHVDTSQIPGGYGLYKLPYSIYENGSSELHDDQIEMVYPLEITSYVRYLEIDTTGENLLMFTKEKDGAYMTVIRIETMETLQKLKLSDDTEYGGFSLPIIYDDFMVVTVYEKAAEYTEMRAVLTPAGDGTYELQFKVPLVSEDLEDTYKYFWRSNSDHYDWNGKQLIMCSPLNQEIGYTTQTPGFCLAVYDASGITYFATYDSSLNTGGSTGNYNQDVTLLDNSEKEGPLKVSWM